MKWKTLAAVLAAGLVLAACSKSSSSTDAAAPVAPADTGTAKTLTIDGKQANDHGTATVAADGSVEIEADTDGGQQYFSPTVITGQPGQKVTVELKNESSSVAHNFSIEDQNINIDLDPEAAQTVTVTLPDSGTVTFFCEYHESSGMLGEFTVG